MWRKETSSDGLGDEIVGAECSVLRSGLPVGMFRFSRRSLFKLRCQPTAGHVKDPELRETHPKVFGRGKRVGAHEVTANARVLFLKALNGFGDDADGGRFGGGNPDVAREFFRRHRFELCSVDEGEDVLGAAKEKVPLFREFEAARGALEELLPEFLFEVRNLAR